MVCSGLQAKALCGGRLPCAAAASSWDMSTAAAAITAPELGLPEHWERDHDRTLQLLERTLALSRILTARASTGEHGRAALAGQHAAEAAARAQPLPSGWAGLHDNPLFAEPSDSSNSGRSMIAAAEAPMTERGGHNEVILHSSGKYSTWVELSDDDALVGASRAELESSTRSRATAHPTAHSNTLQSSSTARDLHIAAPRQDTLCTDVDTIQQVGSAVLWLRCRVVLHRCLRKSAIFGLTLSAHASVVRLKKRCGG